MRLEVEGLKPSLGSPPAWRAVDRAVRTCRYAMLLLVGVVISSAKKGRKTTTSHNTRDYSEGVSYRRVVRSTASYFDYDD